MTVQRVFEVAARACKHCFPNVRQEEVTLDDREDHFGKGTWDDVRHLLPRLAPSKNALAMSVFRRRKQRAGWLKCPDIANATMGPAAHSQQVAYEECLLATGLCADGSLADVSKLTRSWATALVTTVGPEARRLNAPSVLAQPESGQAWLVVLSLGRCLLGWPLRVLSSERRCLGLIAANSLDTLIVTDPYPCTTFQTWVSRPSFWTLFLDRFSEGILDWVSTQRFLDRVVSRLCVLEKVRRRGFKAGRLNKDF